MVNYHEGTKAVVEILSENKCVERIDGRLISKDKREPKQENEEGGQ